MNSSSGRYDDGPGEQQRLKHAAAKDKEYQTLSPSRTISAVRTDSATATGAGGCGSEVNMLDNCLKDSKVRTEVAAATAPSDKGRKCRVPRRVIHCSDGVVEEYSTDEEELELLRSAANLHLNVHITR